MREKLRKRLGAVVGGLLAIVWLVYYQYLYDNSPRIPDETVGRVYPFSFRGAPGYADLLEIAIFWSIPFLALVIAGLNIWINIWTKKKDR